MASKSLNGWRHRFDKYEYIFGRCCYNITRYGRKIFHLKDTYLILKHNLVALNNSNNSLHFLSTS